MRKKISRLVKQFVPEEYDLNLRIDDKKLTFSGKVKITGKKVGAPNKRIVLHQKNLNISSVKVMYHGKTKPVDLKIARINTQKAFDELRIHLGQLIYPGKYTIEVDFNGTITTTMEGIYPCFFANKGKEDHLIATQFESHSAREAFPCIDEPAAKAVFNLTLDTVDAKAVVSNTGIKKQRKIGKRLITSFMPTPRMSSYLLAFVYGDMEYLEDKTRGGVKVRAYATPANKPKTKFALEVLTKTLDFYSEYYGLNYPLSKCDLVALPDFAAGAMENWGCITFREQSMLVDANSSLAVRQFIATTVTHELAHQWFGNLVTMSWWNDLWLNESFASWMSYLAVDNLFPDWKVWTQFIVEEQEQALSADALENTHPVEVTINHPDEIYTIFDSISYEKGASLINMLNAYLGAETFQKGINLYLKKHAYSNSVTTDLWAALEVVSKKDVSQFMHAWISLSGFPLIKVQSDKNKLKLSQSRFYINPKAKKIDELWPVPVTVKGPEIRLFNKSSITIPSEVLADSGNINENRVGFYRVAYSEKYLKGITKNHLDDLAVLDRLALISDQVEAAKAGYTSTLVPLKLMELYETETELVVWDVMTSFFSSLRSTLRDKDLREDIKPYLRNFVQTQLVRLGLAAKTTDSYFDKLLRPNILALAAIAEEPTVTKYCFKAFKVGNVPPDYRRFVYPTIARSGGAKEYAKFMQMHQTTTSPEEKLNLTLALCAFEDTELIKRNLEYIRSEYVKPQDVFYWVSYSFANFYGRDLTWKWLKENWQWLYDNFRSDLSFHRMPKIVARNYASKKDLKDYLDFFESRRLPSLDRAISQGSEMIQWHAAWRERDLKAIKNYFSNFKA